MITQSPNSIDFETRPVPAVLSIYGMERQIAVCLPVSDDAGRHAESCLPIYDGSERHAEVCLPVSDVVESQTESVLAVFDGSERKS